MQIRIQSTRLIIITQQMLVAFFQLKGLVQADSKSRSCWSALDRWEAHGQNHQIAPQSHRLAGQGGTHLVVSC